MNLDNIKKLGKLIVFYIPSKKITSAVREDIHNFFVSNHNAYTHISGSIVGYWVNEGYLFEDHHERYEISIEEKDLSNLIDFISNVCNKLEEKSIYVTIGSESYLVYPS